MNQAKVARVRRLLSDASIPEPEQVRRMQGPLGTIRRKYLIQHAKLLAARYSLQEQLEASVYATGHAALTGLDLDELEHLVARIEHMGSRLDMACDPPGAPPAR